MYAEIERNKYNTIAVFSRDFPYSIERVWQMLSDNEYLKRWFSELNIIELVKGGKITFNMGEGQFEEMLITQVMIPSVLEFTWDKNYVRFDLSENTDGSTHMVFKELIMDINDHTPRDIAGWHICLDKIRTILDGNYCISNEKESWEKLYEYYKIKFRDL